MAVNDSWRQWIAENIALNGDPASLVRILIENGVAETDAAHEVQLALDSPYLKGASAAAKRATDRLSKHEWVLDVYRTLRRQTAGSDALERRHKLSRDEFYRDYYLQNKPVIITGMLDDWPALEKWSLDYFRERTGAAEVEVQMGRSSDSDYEINSTRLRSRMPFSDYIDLLAATEGSNDFYMTANNSSQNRVALGKLWEDIGRLPEYLNPNSVDDGFLWIGPKGTRTPLHHDLTNNFMAQIMGSKRIKLIPAFETARVYNHRHCFSQVDAFNIDYQRFPMMREVQLLDFTLERGELLFLPVGTWHCVEGLQTSVTVTMINFLPENNFSKRYVTFGEL